MSLGEHRKQKPFLKFNDLQCPTCKKCLYSANHDECVLEYLSRLNPRASAQNKDAKSHKTTKRYMPVEKSSESKKPERLIPKGHRFSHKKTTTVPEKTRTPRSCLRWQPTGRILKTVCLRWVPTGKLLNSCTGKISLGLHGNECLNTTVSNLAPHDKRCLLKMSLHASFLKDKRRQIMNNTDPTELHQFDRLKVRNLVDTPVGKMIIKLNGIDFKSFAPVARLEQFGFCCPPQPTQQAPRACYDELSNFPDVPKLSKGLQIHQFPKSYFINQAKYALEILKKHNMDNCHSIGTPLATKPKLDMDLSGEPSLGDKLVSGFKEPNCTAMSSSEQSTALSASCAQVMWMRTHFNDIASLQQNTMVVRLGINPMIQPEPEDLPKDNPKLKITVLSNIEGVENEKEMMDKGLKKEALHTTYGIKPVSITYAIRITKMIAGSQAVIKSPTQYHCDICQNIQSDTLYMSMLVKVTRSQDGIDDKDNDKGSKSRSQSMKEQDYNEDKDQEHSSLNDKSNLTDLMKECHQ
ncbi:hypothetical protein Tco_0506377 [Tanacetum coccineum]